MKLYFALFLSLFSITIFSLDSESIFSEISFLELRCVGADEAYVRPGYKKEVVIINVTRDALDNFVFNFVPTPVGVSGLWGEEIPVGIMEKIDGEYLYQDGDGGEIRLSPIVGNEYSFTNTLPGDYPEVHKFGVYCEKGPLFETE